MKPEVPNQNLLNCLRTSRVKPGLALAVLLGATAFALAGTVTWTGGGSDANWVTPGNWTPGVPGMGDILVFDGSTQATPNNNFPANTSFGGITFPATAGTFTVDGNLIGLSGVVQNSGTILQTIALPLNITGLTTFNTFSNNNSGMSGDILVSGVVTGASSIFKVGGGNLTLNMDLSQYSGTLTVSNGQLTVQDGAGAIVYVNGNYSMNGGSLVLDYNSYWSAPTIAFTANTTVIVPSGRRVDFAGSIGSPGYTLTKTGPGSLNLVYWAVDPTAVVKASAIDIAEGTVSCFVNGGTIAQMGGTNVPVTVEYGAALNIQQGNVVPNSITLQGGSGPDGRGILLSDGGNSSNTNAVSGNITFASDSTIGVFGGRLVLAGNISGPGSLNMVGSLNRGNSQNLLVLGGNNTYSGSTTINTGIVQLASSTALPGSVSSGNVTLNNYSKLDLNGYNAALNGLSDDNLGNATIDNTSTNPSTLTMGGNSQFVSFVGAVKSGGGPLSLVKVGSGTASFTGPNSYSGSNVVSGGKLEVNIPTGVSANGVIALADNTEFSVHKTVAGAAFKTTSLTLGSGTTLDIDLGNFGSPSIAPFSVTNGSGTLLVAGPVTVNIGGNPSLISIGQFALIRYLARSGSGNFVLGALPPNVVATLVTNANGKSIDLKVTSAPVTTWVGNVSGDWDVNGTANWTVLGVASKYQDGVGVLFPDSPATNYINITTTVYPGGVLVSANTNYTFDGAGGLGSGDLSKSGNGTLTLLTMNSYGNTTVSGGTLAVGNGTTAGSLGYGNLQNDATVIINHSDLVDIGGIIAGAGTIVKQNVNTLNLGGVNTYSGGTLVSAGVVQLGNAAALGSPASGVPLATVATGAGLDISGKSIGGANPIVASGPGANLGQGAVYNSGGGTCIGCGTIGIQNLQLAGDTVIGSDGNMWDINGGLVAGGYNIIKVGNCTINMRAAVVSSPAQFIIGGGGVYYMRANCVGTAATTIVITNNAWMNTWDQNNWSGYTIPNNFVIGTGGGQIRNSQGAWYGHANYDTYTGNIEVNDTLTLLNTSTYSGSPNPAGVVTHGTMTLNGVLSGPGGVICNAANTSGGNIVTLNGVNTYTGATTVSGGTLAITTGHRGGGAYTVADTAVLDIGSATGYSNMPMSSLTLGNDIGGAVLAVERLSSLSTSNAPITATNLTLIGANSILVPGYAFTTPGQYPLIKYTGSVAGGGTLALGGGARGLPGYISNNVANSSIDLVVPGDKPVLWVGNLGNAWDIGGTANWSYESAATTYQQPATVGDAVTFDDSSSVNNVNVTVAVSPAMVVVTNATQNYTISGYPITGNASLLKGGPGRFTLANTNSFIGGTFIEGGTLSLGSDGALNNVGGVVTVANGATLDLNNWNPNGVTVNASGAGVGGEGAIVDNFSPNANNTRGPSIINMTGPLTIGGTNRWSLRNGAHVLNSPSNSYTLTKVGTNLIDFYNCTISPNLGDIVVLSGTFSYRGNAGNGLGDPTKEIRVGAGATFNFNGSPLPIAKTIVCSNAATITADSAGQTIGNPIILDSGTVTFNANYNNTATFTNIISGLGGVWFYYNSEITFSAANTYSGNTEVTTGPGAGPAAYLRLSGNGSISNSPSIYLHGNGWASFPGGAVLDASTRSDGTFTLVSGQTLRGDTGASLKGAVVASPNSTIWPGGVGYIQAMAFSNSLTFQGGSTCSMDLNRDTGTNDVIIVNGTLTMGGTLALNRIGSGFIGGESFKLFSAGTFSGSFANIMPATPGPNMLWDTSALASSGVIKVIGIVIQPVYVSGSDLVLRVNNSILGRNYVLYTTPSLEAPIVWTPVLTNAGTGGNLTNLVPITTSSPHAFFEYLMQ